MFVPQATRASGVDRVVRRLSGPESDELRLIRSAEALQGCLEQMENGSPVAKYRAQTQMNEILRISSNLLSSSTKRGRIEDDDDEDAGSVKKHRTERGEPDLRCEAYKRLTNPDAECTAGTCVHDRPKKAPKPAKQFAVIPRRTSRLLSPLELFEQVAVELNSSDLLRLSQTNKTINFDILNNQYLKKHVGAFKVDPRGDGAFRWTFLQHHLRRSNKKGLAWDQVMVDMTIETDPHHYDMFHDPRYFTDTTTYQQITVEAQMPTPNIGLRVRELQVCVPGVPIFSYYPSCCGSSDPVNVHHLCRPETGVTFGDVFDAVAVVSFAHRFCPNAPIGLHDKDGIVRPVVQFRHWEVLPTESAIVQEHLRRPILAAQARIAAQAPNLANYRVFKWRMAVAGGPVLTLQMYNAHTACLSELFKRHSELGKR